MAAYDGRCGVGDRGLVCSAGTGGKYRCYKGTDTRNYKTALII